MSGRSYDRSPFDMRPVKITTGVNSYVDGSALIEFGNTKVLCTAILDKHLPQWLSGSGQGWLTAEYAMLPSATHTRTKRERDKVGGRTLEIQRLIGRSLRSCVDLKKIPDKSLIIDCDVLQADGGTRTASITGGYVALALALRKFGFNTAITGQVAAISVGMKQEQVLVDLDYSEDSTCDVDMNFVMTSDQHFVEIQGTGEHKVFSKKDIDTMMEAATGVIIKLQKIQQEALK